MEAITLAELKERNPRAYAGLPAKLLRASFVTDGKRVSATLYNSTYAWNGRKWTGVMLPVEKNKGGER